MDIDVDFRQLTELDEDFNALPKTFMPKVQKRVNRGAFNIKRDWKQRWEGHDHIPHLPNAISYDVYRRGDFVGSEIGPDKDKRQGPLGSLVEFGSINNAPIPGGVPALELEEPRFVDAMADLGEQGLGDGPR